MRRRAVMFVLWSLLCAAVPGPARAFDHELQLGADLFYAQLFVDDELRPPGGGLGVHARYGFNDYIAVALAATWAGHDVAEPGESPRLMQVVTAAGGIVYAVDVDRVVPFLALHVGTSVSIEEQEASAAFLLDIGGGIDWSVAREFSIGLAASYQLTATDELLPARLFISIRLNWERALGRERQQTGG